MHTGHRVTVARVSRSRHHRAEKSRHRVSCAIGTHKGGFERALLRSRSTATHAARRYRVLYGTDAAGDGDDAVGVQLLTETTEARSHHPVCPKPDVVPDGLLPKDSQRVVRVCAFAMLLASADRTIFSLAALAIASDLNLPMTTVGSLQSSFLWGYGMTQVIGGVAADIGLDEGSFWAVRFAFHQIPASLFAHFTEAGDCCPYIAIYSYQKGRLTSALIPTLFAHTRLTHCLFNRRTFVLVRRRGLSARRERYAKSGSVATHGQVSFRRRERRRGARSVERNRQGTALGVSQIRQHTVCPHKTDTFLFQTSTSPPTPKASASPPFSPRSTAAARSAWRSPAA